MSNPFMQYLMDDISKEIGDEPRFVYERTEPRLAAALTEAACAAGFRAEIKACTSNLADVIVQQP
jgi:enoyl reductase-like protein